MSISVVLGAMGSLIRKRRPGAAGEPEEVSAMREHDYQTALGLSGANGVPGPCPAAGEASPGTLESGDAPSRAVSPSFPTANPFHSERVKKEIAVMKAHPAALDEEALRFTKKVNEAALGDVQSDPVMEPAALGEGRSGA